MCYFDRIWNRFFVINLYLVIVAVTSGCCWGWCSETSCIGCLRVFDDLYNVDQTAQEAVSKEGTTVSIYNFCRQPRTCYQNTDKESKHLIWSNVHRAVVHNTVPFWARSTRWSVTDIGLVVKSLKQSTVFKILLKDVICLETVFKASFGSPVGSNNVNRDASNSNYSAVRSY